jgi:hypothetical protein
VGVLLGGTRWFLAGGTHRVLAGGTQRVRIGETWGHSDRWDPVVPGRWDP